jgi:hypothetical protein
MILSAHLAAFGYTLMLHVLPHCYHYERYFVLDLVIAAGFSGWLVTDLFWRRTGRLARSILCILVVPYPFLFAMVIGVAEVLGVSTGEHASPLLVLSVPVLLLTLAMYAILRLPGALLRRYGGVVERIAAAETKLARVIAALVLLTWMVLHVIWTQDCWNIMESIERYGAPGLVYQMHKTSSVPRI